ncbi:hypothetical protein WN55_05836 [Dufourea novaeangliae]|uniref:Uncharacterized protein n=1 Tax=Dufourea novaeangliae TaxID=178035 RepID=A0A154P079_DUFNO|nr:hypothetical protein WN55_05836 [Dufourea novaeangliae]
MYIHIYAEGREHGHCSRGVNDKAQKRRRSSWLTMTSLPVLQLSADTPGYGSA